MILPTGRALALFVLLAPLGLLGFTWDSAAALLIAADTSLLLLIGFDAYLAVDVHRLSVVRQAPDTFSVGRPTRFHYRWQNPTKRRARLQVREVRPDILGGTRPARYVEVPAATSQFEQLIARPLRRGHASEGAFAVRSRGPLGLGQRQARLALPWEVVVYPSLPASRLKASIAEAVQRSDLGLRPVRRMGEGRQFESLREWVPGDDPRHIDWKATARYGNLITRQYEAERRQQVLLVLDAGRLLTAEVAGEARMEHVVRAALWLAFAAVHHDDSVGLMAFADEILHYAAPQRGRRALRNVLDALAVLDARLAEPDYPAAFRYLAIRNRKRALTIFFTDIIDRLASEALVANVASLRPRHLPLVVTLRNPELDRAAQGRPDSVAGAYRKAAAEELLAARDDALAQMRRSGALVLDVHPSRASQAVVHQYLEIKRRGRL